MTAWAKVGFATALGSLTGHSAVPADSSIVIIGGSTRVAVDSSSDGPDAGIRTVTCDKWVTSQALGAGGHTSYHGDAVLLPKRNTVLVYGGRSVGAADSLRSFSLGTLQVVANRN